MNAIHPEMLLGHKYAFIFHLLSYDGFSLVGYWKMVQ